MIVYVLRSVNPEDKPQDATSVSIYSTRELALDAFEKQWTEWNSGLDLDEDCDLFVNVLDIVEELQETGSVGVLSGYHILDEYTIDSNRNI